MCDECYICDVARKLATKVVDSFMAWYASLQVKAANVYG